MQHLLCTRFFLLSSHLTPSFFIPVYKPTAASITTVRRAMCALPHRSRLHSLVLANGCKDMDVSLV